MEIPQEVKNRILSKIGALVKEKAIRAAPDDLGELRGSIDYRIEGDKVIIYAEAEQAYAMEYGCFFNDVIIGNKRISKIKINDLIWTGESYKRVIQKEIIEVGYPIKKFTIKTKNGKVLILTEDHPIFTKNRGWLIAKELNKKDLVYTLW